MELDVREHKSRHKLSILLVSLSMTVAKAENISKFIKNLYRKEKQNPLCDMIRW